MKIFALVASAILSTIIASAAVAADSQYDNQYEFASYAKAIDIANARLAHSAVAYNDQYEYAAAAKTADLGLIAAARQLKMCAEQQAGCISNGIQVTTFKPNRR